MHIFDYQNAPAKLLTPEITALLSAIHEFKGKQELYLNAKPDVTGWVRRRVQQTRTVAQE